MGILDELRKITQPYDEEDDIPVDAGLGFKPQPKEDAPSRPGFVSAAQAAFENSFGDASRATEVQPQSLQEDEEAENTSIFGNFGLKKKEPKPRGKSRTMSFGGRDTSVMLFSPKNFDEAGELVTYLMQNLTVVMTLEKAQPDMARRLLDFMSGIAFALQGRITPVSAKTYFVTPQNVDILGAQADQPESSGQYL